MVSTHVPDDVPRETLCPVSTRRISCAIEEKTNIFHDVAIKLEQSQSIKHWTRPFGNKNSNVLQVVSYADLFSKSHADYWFRAGAAYENVSKSIQRD